MTAEEFMQVLTALLAIVALLGAIAIWVLRWAARSSATAAALVDSIGSVSLWLAFVVAATATGGSLWFSEIANYAPCRFCWFQRIFMFSQTVVLFVAALRKDRAVRYTAIPLSLIGAAFSVYHRMLELGYLDESSKCDPSVPCSQVWFERFGPLRDNIMGRQWGVTLAVMAFCGFMAIIALVALPAPARADASDDVDGAEPTADAAVPVA